ncbi:hypothetical protein BJ508DRAFT_410385 [Ascobolus immersus RN42]|uniref:L-type lectin-like domain-containing protein n=1 Tax=Ascobolus immersus RN42 TaxID=1160509 RepID=A0A3N4IPG4_ASCIM|nr:hypothetical protein BJ508DRAFT_410385 [Ascobolus immersus RN42]
MRFLPSWCSTLAVASLLFGNAVNVIADDPSQAEGFQMDGIKSVPLRTHSLYQPYLDSDLQSRWFDWGGDTIIRADKYVRLTSDRQSQVGWLWSRLPLTATNWVIEFDFKIHGRGTNLYGDGMALWITKQRAVGGPVFGSMDKFEGLGIFFDTYKNNRPGVIFPYVMAMLGDGQKSYDKEHDGKEHELAGCSARGIRDAAVPTRGRLTYFQDDYLQLELQYKNENEWTPCFRVENVNLPAVAYLGFTADTGELTDNHDIIAISARNLYYTTPPPKKSPQGKNKAGPTFTGKATGRDSSAKSGSWLWSLFKFLMFGAVLAGAYVGFTIYRSKKKMNRF